MAAAPAKPSPSNKEIQQTEDLKDTLTTAKTADAKPTSDEASIPSKVPVSPPASVQTKITPIALPPSYASSESSDHFLTAKKFLAEGDFEQSLTTIEQGIEESKALLMSIGVEPDLHECLAPFHYLYGTTLLYSIEESNDTQMTVAQNEPIEVAAEAAMPQEEQQMPSPAENVEDMEIAWENLDTARNIVEHLLPQDNVAEASKSKLQLDLAQILLREGDLQRMNGRYSEAIDDYQACLQLRKLLLPTFDRKIADAQYNLGLSYLSNSTELQKDEFPDAAKKQTSQEHCQKGVELYVECAKTLCGLIAGMCDVPPDTIFTKAAGQAGFKETGLEDAIASSHASQTLSVWRKNVSSLPPAAIRDPTLDDLGELLDEIQETVDEAERSHIAVREASRLKFQAEKAVTQIEDGPSTTIGFDAPTFSEDAVSTNPAARPMLVIKKKKKREAQEDMQKIADLKRSKNE